MVDLKWNTSGGVEVLKVGQKKRNFALNKILSPSKEE